MRPPLSAWGTLPAYSRQSTPWVFRQCLRPVGKKPRFSTSRDVWSEGRKTKWRERIRNIREHRRVAITATVVFVAGAGALAFSEKARYAYIACERCGRVGVTLYLCIREYLKVLKKENWDNPDFQAQMSACHKRCAERTLRAMEKNGSIFIKLGQHLSSLNYILANEWCDTFIPLQDQCPVSSFESIDKMVKLDTGKSLEDIFAEFEPHPIGAASLAQVHIARMKDTGEKVAVKVQHPMLDEWAALDLWLTSAAFKTVRYFFPEYDLTWLSDQIQISLPKELDFREEGRNAKRTQEYFSHIPNTPLVIPDVIWAERRILAMEYIAGHRTDDLEFLDANGISRDEVAAALARIFNEMIFGTNAPLHCDPHGGNLAVRVNNNKRRPRNFDVILYDHGLYRDIPMQTRRAYAHMWLAVLDVDEPNMRKYAWEIAGVKDDEFPIFASAITGRDYSVVKSSVTVARKRTEQKRSMTQHFSEDLVEKMVGVLGRVPAAILLILKTNDLTRSLDENLHTTQGPIRCFLILAQYAARCIYEEQVEQISGSVFRPTNLLRFGSAWLAYAKVAMKLRLYEYYLSARRHLGLHNVV